MQRQLRLGDILDDYCPRERRVTNHAVVAMVGDAVKQTRCATCEAEHEYKHGKVPRQRRKPETPAALYAQVAANTPKRVVHDASSSNGANGSDAPAQGAVDETAERQDEELAASAPDAPPHGGVAPQAGEAVMGAGGDASRDDGRDDERDAEREEEEGPVHRPLIRASLPRHEGQPPPTRPIPEFTIRQPAGRQNRFRPRFQRPGGGGQQFQGNRSGGGNMIGGPPRGMRQGGGRPPQGAMSSRSERRNDPGGQAAGVAPVTGAANPPTVKQLYIKYLKGEATFEEVEAAADAFAVAYNARYTAASAAKRPK